MKIPTLTSFLLFAFFGMHGQNLVPNSSFEDTLHCGADSLTLQPKNWFSPTDGTPDFFYEPAWPGNGCVSTGYPSTFGTQGYGSPFGYQLPRTGGKYVGTRVLDEFLEVKLMDSLKAGRKYCVEAFVSLANSSGSGLDLLQFCFSKDSIISYDMLPGNIKIDSARADAESTPGILLIDTAAWMYISDTFVAKGGERYLTVGNFDYDTSRTQYQAIDTTYGYTYYYYDDIVVYYCDTADTSVTPAPPNFSEISLTPNPGSGEFQIKGNFPADTHIQLYDMLGQKLSDDEIPEGNQSVNLNYNFAEAVYLYRVVSAGMELKSGKLVIAK